MRFRSYGTILAALGLAVSVSTALAATLAGTVGGVGGSCTIRGRALKSGDKVQVGDTIEVAAGGNLSLRMVDGSVISVAPGTSMTVASYSFGAGRDVKLSVRHGLLRALVTPVTGPSTFEVSAAVGTASVHSNSADWFIDGQADFARVGVLAGTVDVTSAATKRSISIPAHWGARLEAERDPVMPRVWSQMEFNAVIRLTECCQAGQAGMEAARPPLAGIGPRGP